MQPPTHIADRQVEFTKFMQAYQNMVFTTAARLSGNDAHAEDIAQEVFLRAHRCFDELRDNPRAAGWLKTVATNLTFTHLTRYRKRWVFFSQMRGGEDDADEPEFEFPADEAVDSSLDPEQRHAIVEAALRELPEHQRVPLVLFHFEDMSYEEIARELRISLAKVKTDMHRARAALAKILIRNGVNAAELLS